MGLPLSVLSSWPLLWLQELLAPEFCVLCGQPKGAVPWWRPARELRRACGRDDPHLCQVCWDELRKRDAARAWLQYGPNRGVVLQGAQHTNPRLVRLVAAWKYGGLRGAALPLVGLLRERVGRTDGILVPVPLHSRRRRQRGFNQATVLAAGLSALSLRSPQGSLEVRENILRRRRATAQQARQKDAAARARNLAGAFKATPAGDAAIPVYVVDDIVTSGATAAAALACLAEAGWHVAGVLCLGVAVPQAASSGSAESPLDG